jgi:hypothetical protein
LEDSCQPFYAALGHRLRILCGVRSCLRMVCALCPLVGTGQEEFIEICAVNYELIKAESHPRKIHLWGQLKPVVSLVSFLLLTCCSFQGRAASCRSMPSMTYRNYGNQPSVAAAHVGVGR